MEKRQPTTINSLSLPLIIAGSCAAESEQQTQESVALAKQSGVNVVRISLIKPRTKPGFEGVKEAGLPWLATASEKGVIPATEVLTSEDAQAFATNVADATDKPVIMWLGARSQIHTMQRAIAEIAVVHPNILLLIKNQPWESEEHWSGIVDHVRSTGLTDDRIILCHRGFAPHKNGQNPEEWRNLPDLRMAMRVKQKTGLPMLIDPSHIVGKRDGVLPFAEEVMAWEDEQGNRFDGAIIETHRTPDKALTDAKQQVTWEQLRESLPYLRREQSPRSHPIETLERLREAIDIIDTQILTALAQKDTVLLMRSTRERWKIVEQVGVVKKSHGRRSLDSGRWEEVLASRIAIGCSLGLAEDEVRNHFETIHNIALEIEGGINQ